MLTLHVGIDDTDSPRKGCTTYVASILVEKLAESGVSFTDYPNLIRLNPNVPWKTRGNGALCLRFRCDEKLVNEIMELTIDTVEKKSDLDYVGTDPGIVFFRGNRVPKKLTFFAKQAIQGLVKLKNALKLVRTVRAEAVGFKSGRGIIGALAAVGETLSRDHTYELITYRMPENYGTPRKVDAISVETMNQKTAPLTFNNIDVDKGRVLITPHGPDPILYGIRGETPTIVKRAQKLVLSLEPIERWTVFRTNQGTDSHLQRVNSINSVFSYHPVIAKGTVTREPKIIPRRHVIFSISDETGQIDCAAYEPTQDLRKAARLLILGDVVEAFGGIRPKSTRNPVTINLEKLNVVKLAPKIITNNPLCSRCGKRMESMGTGQGFKCRHCDFRSSTLKKEVKEEKRPLEKRLYVTSPRSQRHLTKPITRYGLEKRGKPNRMISNWFWVNG
jgi:tRNA(Ile2)-agmatinylcytidine synthase